LEFREATLDNGLDVVAECNEEAHSMALGFFVKSGSRDESAGIEGVSHFLEHMVFKGTPKRSADDVNREFDEMGAHYNAFTSEENTVYYAAILPEYQEAALELLADIMRPSLREEDFDTEKQVIIEEIRMYEDQPPFGADDRCKALHFGSHPLGNSVLGTVESITDLGVDQMRDYFQARYSPRNITLAASGKVDFDELTGLAERFCDAWQPIEAPRVASPAQSHGGFECIEKPQATQQYAILLANGPAATDPDRYAAKLLATIVGDDSGSRLYWELIDPGLAEHASLSHYDYEGTGLFGGYLGCAPEQAQDNLQRIFNVFAAIQNEGITSQDLDQARRKVSSRVVLGAERPRNRLFNVGGNWQHRHEYRTVKDDLDALAALTVDDCMAVLKRYPLVDNTIVTVGPNADLRRPTA
jgi:predicted Zn-dependent peptidase